MAVVDGEERSAGATCAVFVSYASQDAVIATTVVEALERSSIACWIAPRDVTPGAFYADEIVHAIDAAKAVVLILSKNAADSPHVLREVEHAASKRHPVVSLRVDQAPLPAGLGYFLNTSQWLDASGEDIARSMPKLIAAVRVAIQAPVVTPEVTPTPGGPALSPSARPVSHTAIIVASLAGLVIAGFAVDRFWISSRRVASGALPTAAAPVPTSAPASPTIPEKSVAVLPFVDMSEKKDQEYLADGMTEEIIDLLVKVPDLHVPARTSSFYFKGKSEDIPTIARRLLVTHVLEGSVRKSGSHLRITAQLIRADNGYHIWSETYDRDLHDVFKVQDDIANAVVQALQITLMGGPLTRQKGGTQNLEAYQLYLRAGTAELQNIKRSFEAERTYLEKAVKLDPSFGLAWSKMAANTVLETDNGMLSPPEGYERARQLAQRALQVSPDLSEPHGLLAYIHRNYDYDWVSADIEIRRALDLDPTNWYALNFAGILAYTLGHWDEAERHLRAALVQDPLNTYIIFNLGTALYGAGRYADAEAMYRRLLELAPDFLWTRLYLGTALLAEGKPEAALVVLQQETDEENRLDILPIVLRAAGRKVEADDALNTLITKFADSSAYFVAMNYAYMNDPDLALQWLERAYQQKDSSLPEIAGEPLFKSLARDTRYKTFLRKMKLPE